MDPSPVPPEPVRQLEPGPAGASIAPAPDKRPGPVGGIGIVALYFALQFGLSALVGGAIGFVLAVKIGIGAWLRHARPDFATINATLRTNPDLRIALVATTLAAAAVAMATIVHRTWPMQWNRGSVPGFGIAPPRDRRAYPVAVVLGFALLLLGGLLTHLLAGQHPVHQDISVMAGKVPLGMKLLLAVLVVAVAPCVEELVFRGVLLSGLASRMPSLWAIVVSAVIFGAAHLPDFGFAWYPVPALILLGLVLGWMRVHTQSLWPAIALHASNNFFAAIAWFVVARPH